MDRNEKARREFAAAAQMRQFAQAMASGQASVRDRFGNVIDAGVRVLFKPPVDYIFDVQDVAAVLDLNAAPGMARVRLTIDTLVPVPVNQAIKEMIVVGRWRAEGAGIATTVQDSASAATDDAMPIQPPPIDDQPDAEIEPPAAAPAQPSAIRLTDG